MTKASLLKSRYIEQLLARPLLYLLIIHVITIAIPLAINLINARPQLLGAQSYYHLWAATASQYHQPLYLLLHWFETFLPQSTLIIIPITLGILDIVLLKEFLKRTSLANFEQILALLLLVLSPAFIMNSLSITTTGIVLFLCLVGFYLLRSKSSLKQAISTLPFLLATTFDLTHAFLVLLALCINFYFNREEQPKIIGFLIGVTSVSIAIQALYFNQPFLLGPFHVQSFAADLVTDLGGIGGASFFVILLAIIGLFITFKEKEHRVLFIPLLISLLLSLLSTVFILLLVILFSISAALTITHLTKRQWTLPTLQNFTLFLIFLGILFSTISYEERLSTEGLTQQELKALDWIKDNTAPTSIILTLPENGPYVKGLAQRPVYYSIEQNDHSTANKTMQMLKASYVQEIFPLLEENNITFIYINPKTKEIIGENQGILFLLQNERFRLAYSNSEIELWTYR